MQCSVWFFIIYWQHDAADKENNHYICALIITGTHHEEVC